MENKTPDYANWIPEANGYVYQGQVVSNKPFTDNNGATVEQVTMDTINQRNNSPVWNGVVPSTPLADYDVNSSPTASQTQVNQSGSNEDVNANITSIGSMGSFGENTEQSTTGVLDTNATKSPNVNIEPLDPMDKFQKDYAYMVATNNIKGQIDALIGMSQIDGVDRTAQIEALNTQRNEKIKQQDDTYSERYMNAMLSGNQEEANKVLEEQNAYRGSVDYKTALADMKEKEQEELNLNYEYSYIKGVNDIVSYIGNIVGQVMNFQYDPTQDTALKLAQDQAIGRIKEQMAGTGMYYSSMTQYAITKACAELVPVYEKMAKDELKDNLNTLMSTANFLMNMEESQFNMWKSNINLQFEQKEQERKAVQDAWDRADYLGYIDNEASLILGIPAGTLSASTRKQILERNEQIAKEERSLQSNMIMADYNADLAIQKMREQERLDEKYWAFQTNNPKPTASSGSLTYSQVSSLVDDMLEGGASIDDVLTTIENSGLSKIQQDALKVKTNYNKKNPESPANNNYYSGNMTKAELKATALDSNNNNTSKISILENLRRNAKNDADALSAVVEATYKDTMGNQKSVFNTKIMDATDGTNDQKLEALKNYYELVESDNPVENIFYNIRQGNLTEKQGKAYFDEYLNEKVFDTLDFNKDEKHNVEETDKLSTVLKSAVVDLDKNYVVDTYKKALDTIFDQGNSFDFDKNTKDYNFTFNGDNSIINMSGLDWLEEKTPQDVGDRSKELASVYLLNDLETVLGEGLKEDVMKELSQHLLDKAKKTSGYSGMKNKDSYKYLKGGTTTTTKKTTTSTSPTFAQTMTQNMSKITNLR